MYADDMALFAESPVALQHMIDSLHKYNKEWKLTLNVDKTKIVIFRAQEPKAPVTYCDHALSVVCRPSVVRLSSVR